MTYTDEELKHGEEWPSLGAKYARAENICNALFVDYGEDVLKQSIDKACNDVYEKMNDVLEDWLFDDTCQNFKSKIKQAVEDEIKHLLTNKSTRFVSKDLAGYYKNQILEMYKDDFTNERVKQLEVELERVKAALKYYENSN